MNIWSPHCWIRVKMIKSGTLHPWWIYSTTHTHSFHFQDEHFVLRDQGTKLWKRFIGQSCAWTNDCFFSFSSNKALLRVMNKNSYNATSMSRVVNCSKEQAVEVRGNIYSNSAMTIQKKTWQTKGHFLTFIFLFPIPWNLGGIFHIHIMTTRGCVCIFCNTQ